MKEVLVLIPAYNEEESIGDFLKKLKEAGVYELADVLVNGKTLFIEGGDIDLCQRENAGCGRKCGQICCKKEGK